MASCPIPWGSSSQLFVSFLVVVLVFISQGCWLGRLKGREGRLRQGVDVRNFTIQGSRSAPAKGVDANPRQVAVADHRLSSFGATDASCSAPGNSGLDEGNRRCHSGRRPSDLSVWGSARSSTATMKRSCLLSGNATYRPYCSGLGTDNAKFISWTTNDWTGTKERFTVSVFLVWDKTRAGLLARGSSFPRRGGGGLPDSSTVSCRRDEGKRYSPSRLKARTFSGKASNLVDVDSRAAWLRLPARGCWIWERSFPVLA